MSERQTSPAAAGLAMPLIRGIRRKFWVLLLALAAPATIAAQGTGSLHGLVNTIAQDGEPVYLPGAQVSLNCEPAPAASRTTLTDDTGHYSFAGVPADTCTMTGSMPGFKTVVKKVTVAAKAQAEVDLVLSLEMVQQRATGSASAVARTSPRKPRAALSFQAGR